MATIDSRGPVLVIDDHSDTRRMLEEFLQLEGIETVAARNGLEGLQKLREAKPSVILLDLSMPVMDGWRFREEQQRLAEHRLAAVPVIVMSALLDWDKHARTLRADDAIPKPIDLDRMLAAVRKYYE
jgi:CheY-like chemotaxis protein